MAEELSKMLRLDDVHVLVLLAVLALSPAICEELLFRGAVMSGLRKHLPVWALLICVGIAFGAAHMSVHKMALTTLSGMVLTFVALRSGSIFPGMIAHFIVNATSVLIDTKHMPAAVLSVTDKALGEEKGFPIGILAVAVAIFATAIGYLEWSARKRAVEK